MKILNTPANPIKLITNNNINPLAFNIVEQLLKFRPVPFIARLVRVLINLDKIPILLSKDVMFAPIQMRLHAIILSSFNLFLSRYS